MSDGSGQCTYPGCNCAPFKCEGLGINNKEHVNFDAPYDNMIRMQNHNTFQRVLNAIKKSVDIACTTELFTLNEPNQLQSISQKDPKQGKSFVDLSWIRGRGEPIKPAHNPDKYYVAKVVNIDYANGTMTLNNGLVLKTHESRAIPRDPDRFKYFTNND